VHSLAVRKAFLVSLPDVPFLPPNYCYLLF